MHGARGRWPGPGYWYHTSSTAPAIVRARGPDRRCLIDDLGAGHVDQHGVGFIKHSSVWRMVCDRRVIGALGSRRASATKCQTMGVGCVMSRIAVRPCRSTCPPRHTLANMPVPRIAKVFLPTRGQSAGGGVTPPIGSQCPCRRQAGSTATWRHHTRPPISWPYTFASQVPGGNADRSIRSRPAPLARARRRPPLPSWV
jgi:hypothetical protein